MSNIPYFGDVKSNRWKATNIFKTSKVKEQSVKI
jgi:hypothetical protein